MNKQTKVIEGAYIPLARRVLVASLLKAQAQEDEISAKRLCATSMHANHVTEFTFTMAGVIYHTSLARKERERIHVKKLFTLLQAGDITIDEFLDCIEAPIKAVEETLGEDRAKSLIEKYFGGLDLFIQEVEP